jgi:hypothetical protein
MYCKGHDTIQKKSFCFLSVTFRNVYMSSIKQMFGCFKLRVVGDAIALRTLELKVPPNQHGTPYSAI